MPTPSVGMAPGLRTAMLNGYNSFDGKISSLCRYVCIGGSKTPSFGGKSAFSTRCGGALPRARFQVTYFECRERPSRAANPRRSTKSCVVEVPIGAKWRRSPRRISTRGLSSARRADATHIAAASVARADLILSWNFQHIVNFERIHRFQGHQSPNGYPPIEFTAAGVVR